MTLLLALVAVVVVGLRLRSRSLKEIDGEFDVEDFETFTHNWREIPRSLWGSAINVLASVERAEDIEVARQAGYAAAIVVAEFPSKRAFPLPGSSARIVPCPAEANDDPTKNVTCASCRLCLDRDLLGLNRAIGFEAHGPQARQVRKQLAMQTGDRLVQIGRREGEDRATSQEEARPLSISSTQLFPPTTGTSA
jgi:hypothetical protein